MQPDNSQSIFILLLVAVITGFVLPSLSKTVEIIFSRRVQKQTEIRDKQLEIIEQLTRTIWEWRFLGKQVSYYGCNYKKSAADEERFRLALSDYEKRVWVIFTEIKALKSRSMVWFPASVADEIEQLYEYIKSDVDIPLTTLMVESFNKNANLEKEFFSLQVFFSEEVTPQIELHIKAIAGTIHKQTG